MTMYVLCKKVDHEAFKKKAPHNEPREAVELKKKPVGRFGGDDDDDVFPVQNHDDSSSYHQKNKGKSPLLTSNPQQEQPQLQTEDTAFHEKEVHQQKSIDAGPKKLEEQQLHEDPFIGLQFEIGSIDDDLNNFQEQQEQENFFHQAEDADASHTSHDGSSRLKALLQNPQLDRTLQLAVESKVFLNSDSIKNLTTDSAVLLKKMDSNRSKEQLRRDTRLSKTSSFDRDRRSSAPALMMNNGYTYPTDFAPSTACQEGEGLISPNREPVLPFGQGDLLPVEIGVPEDAGFVCDRFSGMCMELPEEEIVFSPQYNFGCQDLHAEPPTPDWSKKIRSGSSRSSRSVPIGGSCSSRTATSRRRNTSKKCSSGRQDYDRFTSDELQDSRHSHTSRGSISTMGRSMCSTVVAGDVIFDSPPAYPTEGTGRDPALGGHRRPLRRLPSLGLQQPSIPTKHSSFYENTPKKTNTTSRPRRSIPIKTSPSFRAGARVEI